MKKLSIILFSILSFNSFAQFVGGGSDQSVKAEKLPWRNRFYMSLGVAIPTGMWATPPGGAYSLADIYLQRTGFGASVGGAGQIGTIFFLKQLLTDKMKVAINVNFVDVAVIPYSWKNLSNATYLGKPYYDNGISAHGGFQLGALYSFSPVDNINLDAYFNINPTASYLGTMKGGDSNYDPAFSTSGPGTRYYYEVVPGLGTGLRKDAGLNFRYKHLLVGADYDFGSLKYNVEVKITDNNNSNHTTTSLPGSPAGIKDDQFTTYMKINTFRVRIGLIFN